MADCKPKNKSHWNKNSKQQVAQDKLRKTIKSGRIVKPDACQVCDANAPLVGHHWRGYDFPLDVWWVCISCNGRLDNHDGSVMLTQARQRMPPKKTDNHNLAAKLALRRHFLNQFDGSSLSVMDCCQGSGVLWSNLRKEYEIDKYWGIDLKPKKGRLQLDSIRVLSQPGWSQNIIDIDTYGSPWKHWAAMLPNIKQPTAVFLTIGNQGLTAMSPESHGASLFFRFPPSTPDTLAGRVARKFDVNYALAMGCKFVTIVEAVEALSDGNARYIGLRVEPKTSESAVATTDPLSSLSL